ncbi:metal-dependent transcriptional regulator [Paucilactobacillus nenjiangensis]|jgi:DtxR family Mn-dependent transcriptional regulator|uniref:metal-dependent transcriptional regulator n=2 Tax=Paucilactobacillus nenjiangensis TaxID=1296540 RepID=UPI0010F5814B|nr:metal-dependent transcriptional regulator [Paucilactobacillus nenjiangensis]
MTPMKEDYIKIIFELGGTERKISNKEIALGLDVAAGSVTEMITKLVEEKLVIHEPYAGITLTQLGHQLAIELVRKHRLWETFLVDDLKYEVADVHSEAEVLEHQTSDKLADALYDFLGKPKFCPHGGVIPDENGDYPESSNIVLADIEDGQEITITRIIDNHDLLTYLHNLGVSANTKVIVLRHEPFEGPVIVKRLADETEISISFKAAHNIFVQ